MDFFTRNLLCFYVKKQQHRAVYIYCFSTPWTKMNYLSPIDAGDLKKNHSKWFRLTTQSPDILPVTGELIHTMSEQYKTCRIHSA